MRAAAYPALQKAAFLRIDDNEDLLECEKSFLESFGSTVLTAANGGKGLELAFEYRCNPGLPHARNESLSCKDRLIGSEYE